MGHRQLSASHVHPHVGLCCPAKTRALSSRHAPALRVRAQPLDAWAREPLQVLALPGAAFVHSGACALGACRQDSQQMLEADVDVGVHNESTSAKYTSRVLYTMHRSTHWKRFHVAMQHNVYRQILGRSAAVVRRASSQATRQAAECRRKSWWLSPKAGAYSSWFCTPDPTTAA